MMKRILVPIFVITLTILGYLKFFNKTPAKPLIKKAKMSPSPIKKSLIKENRSIFIPDWNLTDQDELSSDYDRIIFFGNVEKITNSSRSWQSRYQNIWFTVKITELPEKSQWLILVKKNINIVKDYNFKGIVLDLEVNGLPTQDLINKINDYVQFYYTNLKSYYIPLAVAMYGDVFYRHRPYDIKFISDNSDEIVVMAYDFHKSRGEPGPNFPYQKEAKYDYDFQMMIDDYLKYVPANKLTIIFGLFGYDWSVDEKKRPISPAKALTLNEVRSKFGVTTLVRPHESCILQNCIIVRDPVSKEIEINYTISADKADDQGVYRIEYHIVWFEDEQSVDVKLQYLKKKGIGSVAYWAWGYF